MRSWFPPSLRWRPDATSSLCRETIPAEAVLYVRDTKKDEVIYSKATVEETAKGVDVTFEAEDPAEDDDQMEEVLVEEEAPETPAPEIASSSSPPSGGAVAAGSSYEPTPSLGVPGVPRFAGTTAAPMSARADLLSCHACSANMLHGQIVCFACGASAKAQVKDLSMRKLISSCRKELQENLLRRTGHAASELTAADLKNTGDVSKRGAQSLDAAAIAKARGHRTKSLKLGYQSILARFCKDDEYTTSMASQQHTRRSIMVMDLVAQVVMPNPGRSFVQRKQAMGINPNLGKEAKNTARLAFFPVDGNRLTQAGLVAQATDPRFGFAWLGTFVSADDFVSTAFRTKAISTLITFTGTIEIPKFDTPDELKAWVEDIIYQNTAAADAENNYQLEQRERNRQATARRLEQEEKGKGKQKGKGKGKTKPSEHRSQPYQQRGYGSSGSRGWYQGQSRNYQSSYHGSRRGYY